MDLRRFAAIGRFIFGFLCSYKLSLLTRQYIIDTDRYNPCRTKHSSKYHSLSEEIDAKDLVLVAVMTHMSTVLTRAVGINETWGREIPGKLLFFVGQSENRTKVDLPLITLQVADDIYPPQRKSMLMLKYIYENYAERFRWFIRADDDVYFRGDNLERLLRSMNNNDDILLGHPGTGKEAEKGKLGLDKNTNFCIGGTGIIMSQSVLRKVYSNLEHCISETITLHEDSEIGRCLRKFVGVQCPWGYEANEFFHQEYGNASIAYHGELGLITSFEKMVSLHPFKDVSYQYRVHVYYLSLKERLNENRGQKLRNKLKQTKRLVTFTDLESSFHRSNTLHCRKDHCEQFHDKDSIHDQDVHPAAWTLFHDAQKFSTNGLSPPVEIIQGLEERGLMRVLEKAELSIKEESKSKLYHMLTFSKDCVGYLREHPIHGNLYEVQYSVKVKHYVNGKLTIVHLPKRAKLQESFTGLVSRVKKRIKTESELINIVLPLSSSLENFKIFMKKVEEMLIKFHEVLKIIIVFFRRVTSPKPFKLLFAFYKKKFLGKNLVWLEVNGVFDASVALKAALKSLPTKNSLLFFSQVEVLFDLSFLQRCRENTEAGNIYFPVSIRARTADTKTEKEKFVRPVQDDFSIFCAYSNDVTATDTWHAGKVSTPLVEQFLSRDDRVLEILRAPDPGLLRIYDRSRCAQSCNDGFNSKNELFDYMMKKNYLIDFL